MLYEIRNVHGVALHRAELPDHVIKSKRPAQLQYALSDAIAHEVDLSEIQLYGLDLRGLNFAHGKFCGGEFTQANLFGANFVTADLSGAKFCAADLRCADFTEANLSGANLTLAQLAGATFEMATAAGIILRGDGLESFQQDFIAEVLKLPNELDRLRTLIITGKIDGTTYEGPCRCLAGSLLPTPIIHGLVVVDTYRVDATSPREQWFQLIQPGNTPENHTPSKLALQWLDEAIAMRDRIRDSMKSPS